MTKTTLKATVFAAAFAVAGFASAQTAPETAPPADPATDTMAAPANQASASSGTSAQQLETALNTAGYSEVTDLSQNGEVWTAQATNPRGAAVMIEVDPTAGTVQETPVETEEAE